MGIGEGAPCPEFLCICACLLLGGGWARRSLSLHTCDTVCTCEGPGSRPSVLGCPGPLVPGRPPVSWSGEPIIAAAANAPRHRASR